MKCWRKSIGKTKHPKIKTQEGNGNRRSIMLTIQIPPDLEQQLSQLAAQLNLPLETFILQSLQQIVEPDYDDTSKAEVLDGIYRALGDVQAGRISPVETLWDDDSND
jgi:predicted transcriptional regulator